MIGMPDEPGWVTLYNPTQQVTHRIPDKQSVIDYFRDRGWYTPEESAAHAEEEAAAAAEALKGKALDDAAKKAGISTSLSADEKRAQLAEKQAESAIPTEETEGVQV